MLGRDRGGVSRSLGGAEQLLVLLLGLLEGVLEQVGICAPGQQRV